MSSWVILHWRICHRVDVHWCRRYILPSLVRDERNPLSSRVIRPCQIGAVHSMCPRAFFQRRRGRLYGVSTGNIRDECGVQRLHRLPSRDVQHGVSHSGRVCCVSLGHREQRAGGAELLQLHALRCGQLRERPWVWRVHAVSSWQLLDCAGCIRVRILPTRNLRRECGAGWWCHQQQHVQVVPCWEQQHCPRCREHRCMRMPRWALRDCEPDCTLRALPERNCE